MTSDNSPSRIITVRPEGLWDEQKAIHHFLDLQRQVARQRLVHGRARVLLDMSEMIVQPQATIPAVQRGNDAVYRAGDKLAMVGHGALLRMQMKRIARAAEVKMFDGLEEAKAWLEQD